jgi:hypothetical protein
LEESDLLDVSLAGEGAGEDGVKDGGQIESVDGRCAGRGNDRARPREFVLVLTKRTGACQSLLMSRTGEYPPLLDSINAQVDPPDTGYTEHTPQDGLSAQRANGKPREEQKVGGRYGYQEEDAHGKEEDVKRQSVAGGLRGDGEEGRNARACRVAIVSRCLVVGMAEE